MSDEDPQQSNPETSSGENSHVGTATATSTYKVLGEFDADTGAGVLGRNTSYSGTPIGVEGAVPNNGNGYGLSTPHDAKVDGTAELTAVSGSITGGAEISDLLGPGLRNNSGTLGLPTANANDGDMLVYDGGDWYAVTPSDSRTHVSDDGSTVVYNTGDINFGNDLSVTDDTDGTVTVDATVEGVGLSAYLSSSQAIASAMTTTVTFDATNADDFGGYDTSTGVYTVQEPGVYHASFTIDWLDLFDAGVYIQYDLRVNGNTSGQGFSADTTTATSNQRVCENWSRTLFGLSAGDTISVAVYQESGAVKDIIGSNQDTYLTLYKVD